MYDSLLAGASGFLLKDAPRAELLGGVRAAARGEELLAPSITRRLIEQFTRTGRLDEQYRGPEAEPSSTFMLSRSRTSQEAP